MKKAGNLVGVHVRPNDLRRHAATYASRSGTQLEIVSKVLLRHSNLATTTQRYLSGHNKRRGGYAVDRQPARLIKTLAGPGVLTRSGYFSETVAVSSIEMVSVTNPVCEYSTLG